MVSRAIPPLVGRLFEHGVRDCYSIVRDWYAVERGVDLPDFPRGDVDWWADGKGTSMYLDNYAQAGFVDAGRDAALQVGDVLLMKVRSKNGVPNHAGIYLGNTRFLHHVADRVSCREVWGGVWRGSLWTVLRYGGKTPND